MPERTPGSGCLFLPVGGGGRGGGAHAVLDSLEETIRPWQEAPWDFSIPPPVPKRRGIVFPCTRLLAGSGLGACGLRSLIRSPSARLWANPGLAPYLDPFAENSFSLPKRPPIRSVPQHPGSSRLLPPAIAAPLPVLPGVFSPRREQTATGVVYRELRAAGVHPTPTGEGC